MARCLSQFFNTQPEAKAHRIEPGMSLAEALALHQWASLRRRFAARRHAFQRVPARFIWKRTIHWPIAWHWCNWPSGVSSSVPSWGWKRHIRPESLLLDIGKVSERFGGERALAEQVARSLAERRFYARLAVADSVGAAWGLAHYGRLSPIASRLTTRRR